MAGTPADTGRPCATVRTYRGGGGDCHLVTLIGAGGKPYRILIDGGMAPPGGTDAGVVQDITDDLARESGGSIDLLAVAHANGQGSGGIGLAAVASGKLAASEVWMGWTANPQDDQATALHAAQAEALNTLRLCAARIELLGEEPQPAAVEPALAALVAATAMPATGALEAVREARVLVRYCEPGDPPVELAGSGSRIHVAGPVCGATLSAPGDDGTLRPMLGNFMTNVAPALGGQGGQPFSSLYSIPDTIARTMPFFQEHYWEGEQWRRIDGAWMAGASQLAFALGRLSCAAGLSLAIDVDGLGVLLFAAGPVTFDRELAERAVYYKAGRVCGFDAGVDVGELASSRRLRVAVVPVGAEDAAGMHGELAALRALEHALAGAAKGAAILLRTDQKLPAAALQRGVRATRVYIEVPLLAG